MILVYKPLVELVFVIHHYDFTAFDFLYCAVDKIYLLLAILFQVRMQAMLMPPLLLVDTVDLDRLPKLNTLYLFVVVVQHHTLFFFPILQASKLLFCQLLRGYHVLLAILFVIGQIVFIHLIRVIHSRPAIFITA